ncbi:protein split ends-like isoform X2 [Belonocnema kinseyi]|nr:protein split ends-like isoform X2 [Belonocnema kinseyi]
MSSRGRGFSSRGGSSYRGRGGGSDWKNSSNSGGRGSYSSSRGGRFNNYTSNQNYDSRNKYNSGGGSDRYSSRGGGRGEHSNSYKRPRDSYSGRDDHRSSSEGNRKRMRNDSYQGGGSGSSQRYSSSYGGSSGSAQYDDNKRSSGSAYEDKRQNDRNSSYHRSEDRHSASRSYAAPPPPRISEMAPPAPRYTSSRGRISHQNSNYRGRSSTRGRGGGFHRGSRSDAILARKRTLGSLDYRRKLLGSRSRDYIQRVRMTTTKMRRSTGTTRLSGSKKDSAPSMKDKDRMAKAINAEFSDEDDEDNDNKSNWDDDEKPHDEDEDEDENEVENEDKDKKKKEEKTKPKVERNTEDEEEKEDAIKEEEDDPKPDEDDDEEVEGKEEDEKGENVRSGSDELPSRRDGRRFIKLICSHCLHRSVTFKEYSLHLYSGKHNAAMRRVAAKHKAMLARMRVVQRQEQRRVEARDAARGTLPSRTVFCPVCKLNYRSHKAVHNLSDSHRQIKRFLTPFCRVCRIQFRSPMLYETHVCSLDHIKRKSLQDEKRGGKRSNGGEAESSAAEDEDKEMNLENFMTLDSVGDVDVEEEEESGEKKKKEKPEGEADEAEKKPKTKQMIKVGSEYIKRVEVQFCELCKVYLPRSENNERAVALHCSTRSHLKRYVRDNDDKALRRQAERIHLQTSTTTTPNSLNTSETAKSTTSEQPNSGSIASENEVSNTTNDCEKASESKENEEENDEVSKNNKDTTVDEEDDDEEYGADSGDKLFDDVDKDLGNILREAEAGARSSDDEDSRYDRFRNTGKKVHGQEKNGDGEDVEEKETVVKKTETKPKAASQKTNE